jgi:acetyl-CoA carboxylase carboxyltransferase component
VTAVTGRVPAVTADVASVTNCSHCNHRWEAVREEIRGQYETQGHPYYASARLWDDGVIDPVDTREVLKLALATATCRPDEGEAPYGIFRM